jgi:hypothetical protein
MKQNIILPIAQTNPPNPLKVTNKTNTTSKSNTRPSALPIQHQTTLHGTPQNYQKTNTTPLG